LPDNEGLKKSVLRLAENIDIHLNSILFNHKAKDLRYMSEQPVANKKKTRLRFLNKLHLFCRLIHVCSVFILQDNRHIYLRIPHVKEGGKIRITESYSVIPLNLNILLLCGQRCENVTMSMLLFIQKSLRAEIPSFCLPFMSFPQLRIRYLVACNFRKQNVVAKQSRITFVSVGVMITTFTDKM
jgi:hypothetical protein